MPNKQSGTGRKTTAGKKSSATVRQRTPRALADSGGIIGGPPPGDPPIIVQGGGSIHVNLPPKFKEKTKKGGKFSNADQDLDRIVIDGGKPIELNANSVIEIYYTTPKPGAASGGGAGKGGAGKKSGKY